MFVYRPKPTGGAKEVCAREVCGDFRQGAVEPAPLHAVGDHALLARRRTLAQPAQQFQLKVIVLEMFAVGARAKGQPLYRRMAARKARFMALLGWGLLLSLMGAVSSVPSFCGAISGRGGQVGGAGCGDGSPWRLPAKLSHGVNKKFATDLRNKLVFELSEC